MLTVEPYSEQEKIWPTQGHHILAQFDEQSVVVYQAYSPEIGRYAIERGQFGGSFSFSRMSWIKPNFLWMMYRSGWGTKVNQEVTLALRIRRSLFDSVPRANVPSTCDREVYASQSDWSAAVSNSSVRLQWDPDHDPSGRNLERRAMQLGLRGEILASFAQEELLDVIDISNFVAEQPTRIADQMLVTPREPVYLPDDPALVSKLRLSQKSELLD